MAPGLKEKLQEAKQTALAARPTSVMSIFQDERLKSQIAAGIPEGSGLTVTRLLVVALNELRRNPELLECTRESMLGALLQAARLGLEVGGPLGHFHLVPFRNSRLGGLKEVTPILGYKGMIVLARRSREITSIGARPWYAGDHFEFAYGLEDRLVHIPLLAGGDRGAIVGFYGVARFTNGGVQPLVMSKQDVDSFRKRSKAAQAGSGPWETDYEAMGSKTVIRRMSAFLPLTVEAAAAIAEDEEREEGRAPEMAEIDLSDFGLPPTVAGDGAQVEEKKARKASTKEPVPEVTTPTAPEPSAAVAAEQAKVAEGGAPSVRYVCPICGAEEDDQGHTRHDDAKHLETAKAKKAAREAESLPLEGGS